MYHLTVFLHILAAIVWIGGMLFLALVLVPALRPLGERERASLLGATGRRFRTVGWIALVVLIVTGVLNAGQRGMSWEMVLSGNWPRGWFGHALALKLVVLAVILGLSVWHDFFLGPASVRASESDDSALAPLRARLRRQASLIGRANATLALLMVALGVILVRGNPF